MLSMLWQLLAGHVFGCQAAPAVPSAALKVKLKLIQAAVKGGRGTSSQLAMRPGRLLAPRRRVRPEPKAARHPLGGSAR